MNEPAHFRQVRTRAALLVADAALWEPVEALGLHLRPTFEAVVAADSGIEPGGTGRAGNAIIALPGRTTRLHLRPARHGGLLGRLWGKRVLGMGRILAELEITARLRSLGAPVPQPALAVGHRQWGFWHAALATVHVEASVDGEAFLAARPDGRYVLEAARAAGKAVRALHDLGGHHPDLHIKNLLLIEAPEGPSVLILDFDRATIVPQLTPGQRMQGLMRLYRSLVKRGLTSSVGLRGCTAFYSAYLRGDRELRRAMRAHLGRERARIRLHRLAYSGDANAGGSR